jgi:putative transposase
VAFTEDALMARPPRIELPGVPLHITQRGVNRCAVFLDDEDRHDYLRLLGLFAARNALSIHAYVLMGNHVHLLTSSPRAGAASATLHRSTQCYVQAFNHRHRRTGTLWEGRFKSCLVATDRYLLEVYRYIERNPVRAGMVGAPADYAWSSVHANLGLKFDSLVKPHASLLALGDDTQSCHMAYREWLHAGEGEEHLEAIRAHVAQQRAYGDSRFQAMVERTLNRCVSIRSRGRPASNSSAAGKR